MAKKVNYIDKRKLILLGFAFGLIVLVVLFSISSLTREKQEREQQSLFSAPTISQTVIVEDKLSYKGKTGKDALALLKERAQVQQDASGMVVSINGRKADKKKREYWAFYVNGKLAPVGAVDYQTKDEDRIEWRIEKY